MLPLQIVELNGNSRQRGVQHGQLLKGGIARAVDFYRSFFKKYVDLDTQGQRARATHFIEPIGKISPLLLSEYEGIAEGSAQKLEDIVMLSARYEILYEKVTLGECSNVFVGPKRSSKGHTLLGQSWDWRPEAMDFRAVLIAHCDDVPDHMMVTECGQPGKYGFNQYGLGLVAAGLCCREKTSVGDNLFVAITRQMLAQTTLSAACKVLNQFPPWATVNFLLADSQGNGVDFEAAPNSLSNLPLKSDQIYWHTNHCRQTNEPCTFDNSLVRGRRWGELTVPAEDVTEDTIKAWLGDADNGLNSISMLPNNDKADTAAWMQTLCSIVLNLSTQTMWVSDGPARENPYQEVSFQHKPVRSTLLTARA